MQRFIIALRNPSDRGAWTSRFSQSLRDGPQANGLLKTAVAKFIGHLNFSRELDNPSRRYFRLSRGRRPDPGVNPPVLPTTP
jgi:hypothetical protein